MESNNSFDVDKIPDASIMAKLTNAAKGADIHPIARDELRMLIPEITERARHGYSFYDYGRDMDRPKLHPHTLRELRYKGYEVVLRVDEKYNSMDNVTVWNCVRIKW